jgi:O-acetyl-ADP-ribose deacetylase
MASYRNAMNKQKATNKSWHMLSQMPKNRVCLKIDRTYSQEDFMKIDRGFIPESMEDKWFIYIEENLLRIHRSWSGICIYLVRFEDYENSIRISKAWANRNSNEYKETDDVYDAHLLLWIIDMFLLGRDVPLARAWHHPFYNLLKVIVKKGDVLDEEVDVLISTGNVSLNMSGGVNGAILNRGGKNVQEELREYLRKQNLNFVEPGTVVRTGPGPLTVNHILHTVAINAFYESSIDLVRGTIISALEEAVKLSANTVAMPTLATGYGPLSMEEFGQGLKNALEIRNWPLEELRIVVRKKSNVAKIVKSIEREVDELPLPYNLIPC